MCTFVAAAQGVLGSAQAIMANRAQASAAKQNAKKVITSMNYDLQGYEQQRLDAFDSAVQEISEVRMKSNAANASVKAAVNEGMSGRTADALVRSVEARGARAITSERDVYDRKSNEVDLNKERTLDNSKSMLAGIKAPSAIGTVMDMAAAGVSAYTAAQTKKANDIILGVSGKGKGKVGN